MAASSVFDQGCIHSVDLVENLFLNGSKRNEMGINIPEFFQNKLVCNCWTNDYNLDQLDAGKSVQVGIECVTVCYLD